jgi:hypothetical protein
VNERIVLLMHMFRTMSSQPNTSACPVGGGGWQGEFGMGVFCSCARPVFLSLPLARALAVNIDYFMFDAGQNTLSGKYSRLLHFSTFFG